MIALPNDYKEFIQLLNKNEVKYLVVGGYAVVIHGYPRFTGEIDVAGEKVNFINLHHLKINKEKSGRNKDKNDLKNLP